MKRIAAFSSVILVLTSIVATARPASAQTPQQNTAARQLFVEGRDLWDDGKFADAEKKFRESLTKYPKAEQADRTAYYLITTLTKLGRTADARQEIESFNRNYPQSTWKSDVEEKRLSLDNHFLVGNGTFRLVSPTEPRATIALENLADRLQTIGPEPRRFNETFNVKLSPFALSGTASLEQEILRLIIEKDADRGIELATERLKVNPSDPAVVANLGVISNSNSAKALPFLMSMMANSATTPHARSQALFYMGRKNADKEVVARALIEMLKNKDAEPAVASTLLGFSVAERRAAIDQIAQSQNAERISMLEKIYRSSENLQLRTQIVQAVGQSTDPKALTFLADVARNDKDLSVRRAAIQALGTRKDLPVKTLEDLLQTLPPTPAR